jgi:hypothetical protein
VASDKRRKAYVKVNMRNKDFGRRERRELQMLFATEAQRTQRLNPQIARMDADFNAETQRRFFRRISFNGNAANDASGLPNGFLKCHELFTIYVEEDTRYARPAEPENEGGFG